MDRSWKQRAVCRMASRGRLEYLQSIRRSRQARSTSSMRVSLQLASPSKVGSFVHKLKAHHSNPGLTFCCLHILPCLCSASFYTDEPDGNVEPVNQDSIRETPSDLMCLHRSRCLAYCFPASLPKWRMHTVMGFQKPLSSRSKDFLARTTSFSTSWRHSGCYRCAHVTHWRWSRHIAPSSGPQY